MGTLKVPPLQTHLAETPAATDSQVTDIALSRPVRSGAFGLIVLSVCSTISCTGVSAAACRPGCAPVRAGWHYSTHISPLSQTHSEHQAAATLLQSLQSVTACRACTCQTHMPPVPSRQQQGSSCRALHCGHCRCCCAAYRAHRAAALEDACLYRLRRDKHLHLCTAAAAPRICPTEACFFNHPHAR